MAGNVLITGASGLLGRELTGLLYSRGFAVVAQYHSRRPRQLPGNWIRGDLSTPETTRAFLQSYREELRDCTHLVHAYGPICRQPVNKLEPADFLKDFHGNVTAFQLIAKGLMQWGRLRSAVALGFAAAGRIRPYRMVLTHAVAKNALLLLVLSLAQANPDTCFNMVSPSTLAGARVQAPGDRPLEVSVAATAVADTLAADRSGTHMVVTPECPQGEVVNAL